MRTNKIINKIDSKQLRKTPEFSPGDTVVVSVKVKEGKRERIQQFEGVVISMKNKGCLLYTSPSPRDRTRSRMPSSA